MKFLAKVEKRRTPARARESESKRSFRGKQSEIRRTIAKNWLEYHGFRRGSGFLMLSSGNDFLLKVALKSQK